MNRDRIYAAELAHDTSGASDREVEACMGEAMDSIVDDLMWHGRAKGLRWGLQDFLHEQDDLQELVSASICTRDQKALSEEIERRLRGDLEGHDAVHDRATAIANERGERE